jgi:hypothetical protein
MAFKLRFGERRRQIQRPIKLQVAGDLIDQRLQRSDADTLEHLLLFVSGGKQVRQRKFLRID